MIVVNVTANNCTPQTIVIGRRGTYDTMQIAFDLSYLIENYGNGTAVLAVKRSQDESAYPAVVTQEDNTLTWTISDTDTYYVGSGECQLMWYVDGGLAKTIIYPMVVMRDILTTAEEPPDGYENWIEHLTELGAETQQNAQDAEQSASEAKASEDSAAESAQRAEDAAGLLVDVSATAITLDPGQPATAEYNDGVFKFGIPKGDKLTYADLTEADKEDLVQGPIKDAQDDAVEAVGTAKTNAVDAVNGAGTTQVNTVNQAGGTQVNAVNQAGATQVQAVEDKGEEVLASIPSDYSDLTAEVDDLTRQLSDVKSALTTNLGEWISTDNRYDNYQGIEREVSVSSGDVVFVKLLDTTNCNYIIIKGKKSDNTYVNLTNAITTDIGENRFLAITDSYVAIQIYAHLTAINTNRDTYRGIIVKVGYDAIDETVAKTIYDNANEVNRIQALEDIASTVFTTPTPANLRGIIGFSFIDADKKITQCEKYKISGNVYFKSSGFYINLDIYGYANNAWSVYDSFSIIEADAPTETAITILTSKYSRMKMAIIPSLMTTGTAYSVSLEIKSNALNVFLPQINSDIKHLQYVENNVRDFIFKDTPVNIITVDASGNGDFTTIQAAYNSITDSDFDNQYEVRVAAGTYNEVSLIPPKYTHTHGMHPNTVIVSSVGVTVKEGARPPVFDLQNVSKLSNMKIISAYGYCVHFDNGVGGRSAKCEALYCKKVYDATSLLPNGSDVRNYNWLSYSNPSIIGMGMGGGSYFIEFDSCLFENGYVASHTNANSDTYPNSHIIFNNCRCTNAYFQLQALSTYPTKGQYICEINGFDCKVGETALDLVFQNNNKPWTVIGGGNHNFAPKFTNNGSGSSNECWVSIETTDKGYIQLAQDVNCSMSQWIKYDGTICNGAENPDEIFGIALSDSGTNTGVAIPCWVGNALTVSLTDGEYGIGSDGYITASATKKIGKIINGVLYRY